MIQSFPEFTVPVHLLQDPPRLLNALVGTAVALNLAVAVWRLPQQEEWQVGISLQPNPLPELPELETSPPGFLFCPFDLSGTQPLHFLPADIRYTSSRRELILAPEQAADPSVQPLLHRFQEEMTERLYSSRRVGWHSGEEASHPTVAKSHFLEVVAEGVRQIQHEEMEKVVLSRTRQVPLPKGFDLLKVFLGLTHSYPLAFVSLVSVPESGTWMGASPETLVHLDRNQFFRTEALAGTQPYLPGTTTAEAIWRQKEIEEQSLVVRYIIHCFKQLRLREYGETGPRTMLAGNLMHLRTDFKVNLKEVDFPFLTTQMMRLLHPTSAVCGMPMEKAKKFILQNEGYSREYYSGFLGPVRLQEEIRLFVTLRCLQLTRSHLTVYAGAGVTGDSVPEKEWQETEMKMETMLSVVTQYT
ncbi:isochorismate synthase [soil metagenome]